MQDLLVKKKKTCEFFSTAFFYLQCLFYRKKSNAILRLNFKNAEVNKKSFPQKNIFYYLPALFAVRASFD